MAIDQPMRLWSLTVMLRLCLWLLLIFSLAAVPRQAAHSQAPERPVPAAAAPSATLSPEQARAALDTLNDPQKRAAVAATLEAIIQAQPAPEHAGPEHTGPEPAGPEPTGPPSSRSGASPPHASAKTQAPSTGAEPATTGKSAAAQPPAAAKAGTAAIPIRLAPNSLGAQVLLSASSLLSDTANDMSRTFQAIQSIPLLWGWTVVMVTNPLGQQLLRDTGWRLAVVVAVALAAELVLYVLLRRPMARVVEAGRARPPPLVEEEDAVSRAERGATEPAARSRERQSHGIGRRIGLALARFALRMVPVLGLLIAGHIAAASTLGGPPDSRLVILAVLEAIAASQTLLAILTLLFMPDPAGLQLFPMRPGAGAYLMRWGRRLILIAVPGYTIGVVALLLGLSPTAHAALEKIVGLALMVCLAIIVVQRRRSVRRWLSARGGSTGVLASLRNGLAHYWHWIALFFLTASWLAWTLSAPDAVGRILWYFAMTALVVIGAALARTAVLAMLGRIQPAAAPGSAVPAAASPDNPLRVRLSFYDPALRRLATLVINVLAVLGLLQLYGIGGLSWLLTTNLGQRVVSGCVTLAVTIALAVAVWEGVNIAIQMHLDTLRREAQAARSARMRTLLPLIRTTLAITVAVVAGLMVLSEVGVNIAPLLAGAGIVGVAIGFGSQKLVQDVITGVFLLLENTMQVGDVVKVGDQSGLVESLSVRTIRLRTDDGSVVVIPFSAVTTVINMTRDYSRAVILVNIAAGEDIDGVIEALRAIVREMREAPPWDTVILDELEVLGLDRIADTALQLKCRVMCTAFGRWSVGREFNRRLHGRFQMVGAASANFVLQLIPPPPPSLPREARESQPAPESAPAIAGQ